jgi:ribosomal protein L11 methyltransferase
MEEAAWLEVSLVVDGEMAEAVAEVLARFASGGAAIESTQVTAGPEDEEGHAIGPLRVCGYLPVDAGLEENRRKLEEALWYLGRIRPLPEATFRPVRDENWAEAWKQHYRPVKVGQRLVIVPAWMDPPDHRRVPVRIDPGMAFGTGTHPTTQLCLELVEAAVDRRLPVEGSGLPEDAAHPGYRAIIDVGCGSGILAIAALKLGLERALGVDVDPQAIAAARGNAAANGVADRLELGTGSVEEVRGGSFSIREAGLVAANILALVIARLLGEGLADLLLPGGWLVASGILEEQAGEVIAAAEAQGLRPILSRQQGDWAALVFQRDVKKM